MTLIIINAKLLIVAIFLVQLKDLKISSNKKFKTKIIKTIKTNLKTTLKLKMEEIYLNGFQHILNLLKKSYNLTFPKQV